MKTEKNDCREPLSGKHIKIILFLILGVLCIGRVINANTFSPEYDELWSLRNYVTLPVAEIFRDVATPNNHTLNTLGMKLFTSPESVSFLSMRMPSILSFALLGFLLICVSCRYLKRICLQFACMPVILLSGLILHYGEVARGYIMQSFFAAGLFFALLRMTEAKESIRQQLFWGGVWLASCICCCLCVSSGVLYAAILTFTWKVCSFPRKESLQRIWKEERIFLISGLFFALFVLLYYGGNYNAFARGQKQFGETFSSAGAFFQYAWSILAESHLLYSLLLTLPGCFFLKGWRRKIAVAGSLSVILMVLSALATKGGPVRIYTGLIPVAGFCAFISLESLLEKLPRWKNQCTIGVSILLCAVTLFCHEKRRLHFADPDLGAAFYEIMRNVPQNLVVIYRPTDAYVISHLYGKTAKEDFAKRLIAPEGILLCHDPYVTGMRFPDFSTISFIPGEKAYRQSEAGPKLPLYYYPIRKLHKGEDLRNKIIFCFVRGPVMELRTKENFLKKHFAAVNGFFNPVQGMMPFYLFAADGNELSADGLIALENARGGVLDFRVIGK